MKYMPFSYFLNLLKFYVYFFLLSFTVFFFLLLWVLSKNIENSHSINFGKERWSPGEGEAEAGGAEEPAGHHVTSTFSHLQDKKKGKKKIGRTDHRSIKYKLTHK